jgi:hypothetical protein
VGRIAGEQEAGILHDALQLREHFTGDEILVHGRDGIGLEAMVLRPRPDERPAWQP